MQADKTFLRARGDEFTLAVVEGAAGQSAGPHDVLDGRGFVAQLGEGRAGGLDEDGVVALAALLASAELGHLAPVFPGLCALPGNNCQLDTRFRIDYQADVTGLGTTLAGGYKDFFAMIDLNYTEADLDISSTDAEATVISARVGWNGQLGGFKGVLWVGAMYQDIAQVLELQLDLGNDTANVVIDQSTQVPTNFLIGGQWDINRSFSVLAELGLGDRQSQMLNLTYRF